MLVVWRDNTTEKKEKAIKDREQLALEEQKLANLLKDENLTAALNYALKLERPSKAYKILDGKTNLKNNDDPILFSDFSKRYKMKR